MTDHTWVLENLASYNAGGLDTAERFRVEAHLATCPDCTRAFDAAQRLDQTLDELFKDARPKPGLEDRAIRRLRTVPRLGIIGSTWGRFLTGAAAVLFVGVLGAGMSTFVEKGLAFPGQVRLGHDSASETALTSAEMPTGGKFREAASLYDGPASTRMAEDVDLVADGEQTRKVHAAPRYKSVDQLAGEMNRRSVAVLHGKERERAVPGDKNLENDEIGKDAGKLSANYNVDRAEEVSVPGPVTSTTPVGIVNAPPAQPATLPPPPGFGQQGQGGGMAGGLVPGGAGGFPAPPRPTADNMPGRSGSTRDGLDDAKKLPGRQQPSDAYYTYRNADPKAPPPPADPSAAIKARTDLQSAMDRNNVLLLQLKEAGEKVKKASEGTAREEEYDKKDEPKEAAPKGEPLPEPKGPDKPPEKIQQPPEEQPVTVRKVIRTGDIEFEIDSFEASVERITKVAAEERGFVSTVNSDKLPNGKVKGSVIVRCPPDNLDRLILKLRALGDLKSQRLGSQDVTKMYTDMESRLRAARAMEARLLDIIKKGTGEIKDLLVAEKELGNWRTRIEELEGEIRYYNNLISLATLTIHLTEREIRGAFAATETERIDMGIEVEDVEKSQQDAHVIINEAKGRIGKSELKQLPGGMSQAIIQFEVAPENAGPLRDRLKQMGVVSRLEVGRSQQIEGGIGKPPQQNVKRYDVQFVVSLYNIAAVQPRETVHMTLVAADTEAAYQAILARVNKSAGNRIISSPLDRQRGDQTSATLSFEVRAGDADAVLTDIKALGEVLRLQMTEMPDGPTVTRSKRGFNITLPPLAAVKPRETTVFALAARDVPESYRAIQEAVNAAKGRMLDAQLNENDRQNVTAKLEFELRRGEEAAVLKAITGSGDVLTRNLIRAQESETVIDSKVRLLVSLVNMANTRPRETVSLRIATRDVPESYRMLQTAIGKLNGWVLHARLNEADQRNIMADLVFEVRRGDEEAASKALGSAGDLLVRRVDRAQEGADVVDTKVRLQATLVNIANTQPRETVSLRLATRDVTETYRELHQVIDKAKGWVINARLNEADKRNITGELVFEVRRGDESIVAKAIAAQGDVLNRNTTRAPDGADVVDTKVRLHLSLVNLSNIDPRENVTLGIEVSDVDKAVAALTALVAEKKGRVVESHIDQQRDGRKTANMVYDVPLGDATPLVAKFKLAGTVRTEDSRRNPSVPDSELAVARIHVVASNALPIVASDEGIWASMRTALSYSFKFLAWSLSWVVFGACVILPWAVLGYAGYRVVNRKRQPKEMKAPEATPVV